MSTHPPHLATAIYSRSDSDDGFLFQVVRDELRCDRSVNAFDSCCLIHTDLQLVHVATDEDVVVSGTDSAIPQILTHYSKDDHLSKQDQTIFLK